MIQPNLFENKRILLLSIVTLIALGCFRIYALIAHLFAHANDKTQMFFPHTNAPVRRMGAR